MTDQELKHIIQEGETTRVQFKRRVEDAYKIACEMVAFSNFEGGLIVIGVIDDSGDLDGLDYQELQRTNNLLALAASDCIKPSILIETETVDVDGNAVLVVQIPKGKDKPYKDNKGIVWIKNGSDKRRVFSNERLLSMMQNSGRVCADKECVGGTSIADVSEASLRMLLTKRYVKELAMSGVEGETAPITELVDLVAPSFTAEKLLQNLSLMNEKGQLTLAGLLLLGKNIKQFMPVFTVKCISFVGNSVAGNQYRDYLPEREMEGNLLTQYMATMNFISRNLQTKQTESEFNSNGQLEIPLSVFVELVVNALIHRDYFQFSAIRLFIFDNRVELHSPGVLPADLTVEDIKKGVSKPRNQLLFEFARYFLPYTGVGSGILRVSQAFDNVEYYNDLDLEEFKIVIPRVNGTLQSGDVPHDVPHDDSEKSRQERIVELVKMNPGITRELMAKLLGVNAKTIGRELAKMKDKVVYKGSGNHGHWELLN